MTKTNPLAKSAVTLATALVLGFILSVVTLTMGVKPAQAAFPGQDGKIAFSNSPYGEPSQIYTINPDGTNQTQLTNTTAPNFEPAFSADGAKIAFTSERDGNEEIYVMNADGSNQTRLTNNTDVDFQPAFSPDGTKIAFTSYRDGNYEVYVMNADGSEQKNLTNTGAIPGIGIISSDEYPAFSPDGTKIAFTSDRDGTAAIYTMNPDGSNPTKLTNNPAPDADPNWSPDGSKITFRSDRDGNVEVYVMNSDGSGQKNLSNSPATDDLYPAFSPDGTKIAFMRTPRDGTAEVYVMNADGSNQTRLTNNPGMFDGLPDWGPQPTVPTSAEQCKKGGWEDFKDASGKPIFKNQGDCVSFVSTGGKNPPG